MLKFGDLRVGDENQPRRNRRYQSLSQEETHSNTPEHLSCLKKRSLSKVVYNNHPVREDGGIGRAVHILYGTDWQLSAESARNNSLKIFS